MPKPPDSSLGSVLGSIALLGGVLWMGLGFASLWTGQAPDGVDGLVFGGLAFVAGCVILYRQARMVKGEQNESGPAESDAASDRGCH
jgi:hypothetical protein